MRYLTGHCNYGGRITDPWDRYHCLGKHLGRALSPHAWRANGCCCCCRRTMLAMMDHLYAECVLEDGYDLAPDAAATYVAPSNAELDAYVAMAQKLPVNDGPEVFGLHSNAAIAVANRTTKEVRWCACG